MASQAEIDLIVNASNALPQVTRDLTRIVNTAENGADTIDLDVALATRSSLATVQGELDALVARARQGAPGIDLDAVLDQQRSVAEVRESLNRVIRAAQTGAAQNPIDIQGVLDSRRTLTRLRRDLNRVGLAAQRTAPDINIPVRIDPQSVRNLWDGDRLRAQSRSLRQDLGRITTAAGRALGSVLPLVGGVAALGVAAGSAAPLIAGLVGAVESILPALAVATQGMLALALVGGTVKLGMQGVSDAIENAFDPDVKPEDLAKSLEALAPSARKFVLELQGMRKEFKELQLGVQDRLFKGLDGSLRELSRSAFPQLRGALNNTATTLNQMARGVATAAADLAADGTLGQALDGATKGLRNLVKVPAQATTAFGQLAAAAAPAFDRITKAMADVFTEWTEGIQRSFKSGELETAIDDAVSAIAQLGRVAGNIFGIIGNVARAASLEGEGLFGTLEKVTQALQDATASEEFQTALGEMSKTASALGTAILPVLTTALGIVASIFTAIGPTVRRLAEVIGDVLNKTLEEAEAPLTSLAEALALAGEALLPIIELGGTLAQAILPALVPLFDSLGKIILIMTPFIRQLADNIAAQLVPILERLPEVLEQILPVFEQAAREIFPALTEILRELAPHLADLGEELGNLLVELAPVIAEFLEFSAVIISKIIPFIGPLLVGLLIALTSSLNGLAQMFSDYVVPALRTVSNLLTGDFSGALKQTGVNTEALKNTVTRAFDLLVGNSLRSIGRFVTGLATGAAQAGARLLAGVSKGIDNVKLILNNLPQIARSAAGALGGALFSAGASLIQGLINGISSKIGQVRSKLGELTGLIPDWKGPMDVDRKLLTPNGQAIMDSLMAGFESRIPEIRAQLGGITAMVPQGVGVPALAGAPAVYVSIGNEAVDQYVTTRVRRENDTMARTLAQGVRH